MKYNPISKNFLVSKSQIERGGKAFMFAAAELRKAYKLPLEPYEKNIPMTDVEHVIVEILEDANFLGINFGVEPREQNKLDLREFANE